MAEKKKEKLVAETIKESEATKCSRIQKRNSRIKRDSNWYPRGC